MNKKYLHTALIYSLLLAVFGGSLFYYYQWEGVLNSLNDQRARSQVFNTINRNIYYPLHGSMLLLLSYSIYRLYIFICRKTETDHEITVEVITMGLGFLTVAVLYSAYNHLLVSSNFILDIEQYQGNWLVVCVVQVVVNSLLYKKDFLNLILERHLRIYWGTSTIVYILMAVLIWNMEWINTKSISLEILIYVSMVGIMVFSLVVFFTLDRVTDSITFGFSNQVSSILFNIYLLTLLMMPIFYCTSIIDSSDTFTYQRMFWIYFTPLVVIALYSLIWFFIGDFPDKEKRKYFDKEVLDSEFYKNDN